MSSEKDLQFLRESFKHAFTPLDASFISQQSRHEANALTREAVAVFLLLRWFDRADAEQEAMAVFEEREYRPLLPTELQWRNWFSLEDEEASGVDHLQALAEHLERHRADHTRAGGSWLNHLGRPLMRVLSFNLTYWYGLLHWVGELPFETRSDRRAVLELFDMVLAETSEVHDGQYQTPANVARLVAALAAPQLGERVYDPCFGFGNFLIAAWQQAERGRQETRELGRLIDVAGAELNAHAFLIGLTRMLLAGIEEPQLDLTNSLEWRSSRQEFDLVLANPPIGAKAKPDASGPQQFEVLTADSAGLFIQHALAQLKPHGRAVIAVPEGVLFRGGAERELRKQLLERGQVEAVIGLPAGSYAPYTNIKGALLLLRSQGSSARVRMVDTTSIFGVRRGTRSSRGVPVITAVIAEQLAQELRRPELRKRRELAHGAPEGLPGTGVLARAIWEVSLEELEASDWDLTPRRREKTTLVEQLNTLASGPRGHMPIVTLADVAKVISGASIKSAELTDEPPEGDGVPYLRIRDLSKGKVAPPTSWVTSRHPRSTSPSARLMQEDVLLSKSGTIGKTAIVREVGVGAIASSGLFAIRVDPGRLDSNFLAAYLSSAACQEWLAAQSRGTAIQHLNRELVERLPVPLPPLTFQLRAAEQFESSGVDPLDFLARAYGPEDTEQVTAQLGQLLQLIPDAANSASWPPPVSLLRPISHAIREVRKMWAHGADSFFRTDSRWLDQLVEVVKPLEYAADIPRGPSLLSVLTEAESGLASVLDGIHGQTSAAEKGRTLVQLLQDWMVAASVQLLGDVRIKVTADIAQLTVGEESEIALAVANDSPLPLNSFHIISAPDWGSIEVPFFSEGSSIPLTLHGSAPKVPGRFSLTFNWRGVALDGTDYDGDVQVSFDVVHGAVAKSASDSDLGPSPYVTGNPLDPVEGAGVFFGREEVLKQIARQVTAEGNVILLEGNRRAGKTSILRHLEGSGVVPGWLAVYANLQGAEGAKNVVGVPTEAVFREIAGSIAAAVIKLGVDTPLPDGTVIRVGGRPVGIGKACRDGISIDAPFADFREYLSGILEVLRERKLNLLLMLDEFDKLQEGIDNGVTSPQVPENIRFLIQTYARFSAILTGSRRLKRLREEYWSALYGLGTSIQVTALDVDNARRVVEEPVRGRLTYSPEAVDRVLALTARQAYLLQCLCNRVFDFAVTTRARAITVTLVEEAAASLVKDNEHFASLWDYSAQGSPTGRMRRQYILLLLAESFDRNVDVDFGNLQEMLTQRGVEPSDEALAADLDYLRELELVEFSVNVGGGRYQLAIPLMSRWIGQQHDHKVVQRRAITEVEEESG